MPEPISNVEIEAILVSSDPRQKYPIPEQRGPLRRTEKELSCVHSEEGKLTKRRFNCHSPTYHKVQGVPLCMIHAMYRLNELLIKQGVEA